MPKITEAQRRAAKRLGMAASEVARIMDVWEEETVKIIQENRQKKR